MAIALAVLAIAAAGCATSGSELFPADNTGAIAGLNADGSVVEFSSPKGAEPPSGSIALGYDGNMWFGTSNGVDRIGFGGAITTFPFSTKARRAVVDIVPGPGGCLWFVEKLGDAVGCISALGRITEFG